MNCSGSGLRPPQTPANFRMNLEDARSTIIAALARMDTLYKTAVFDEWVMVSFRPSGGAVLAYQGPRAESYKSRFTADLQPLREEVADQKLAVGDFVFVHTGAGTRFDACVRIGESSYLFCNHTGKDMEAIRANPRWLEAQKGFAGLSERFRTDPLV